MIKNKIFCKKKIICLLFSASIQSKDILRELKKLNNYSCRLFARILKVLKPCVGDHDKQLAEKIEPYLYANRTRWQRMRHVISSDAMKYMIKYYDNYFIEETPNKYNCSFVPKGF